MNARPKKEVTRKKVFTVRFTQEQFEKLKAESKARGIKISALIRQKIEGSYHGNSK